MRSGSRHTAQVSGDIRVVDRERPALLMRRRRWQPQPAAAGDGGSPAAAGDGGSCLAYKLPCLFPSLHDMWVCGVC